MIKHDRQYRGLSVLLMMQTTHKMTKGEAFLLWGNLYMKMVKNKIAK
jgi:hypothetical protein